MVIIIINKILEKPLWRSPPPPKQQTYSPQLYRKWFPTGVPQAHLNEWPFKGNNPGWLPPNIPFTIKVKILSTIFFPYIYTGFKLMYCDSVNVMHFLLFTIVFTHLLRKSRYQRRFLFSKPRIKNKILSCC